MTDLVPSERMGWLYDDLRYYPLCVDEPDGDSRFAGSFVEIARYEGVIKVVDSGHLRRLGRNHPVAKSFGGRKAVGWVYWCNNPQIVVPLPQICEALRAFADEHGLNLAHEGAREVADDELYEMKWFLGKVNGAVTVVDWPWIDELARLGEAMSRAGCDFREEIVRIRNVLEPQELAYQAEVSREMNDDDEEDLE
jgi:hypothetical protein